MPIYTEEVKDTNLHKTAVELETSQILNSSKVNDAITNNISGYKWKVNFYNQILSKMDAPKQLDTAVNITIQPYRLIEDVEMILTSPITSASTTNLNGDAYIDIRSAVFKYDMFIAEVHNKVAIFYVDEVQAETYEDNTIYKIIFKLFAFTSDKATYENLINKVATNYVFNKNYKLSNESPILLKADVFNYKKGLAYLQSKMLHYYQEFFDIKLNLLIDKTTKGKVLDIYLNKFIKGTFDSNLISWVSKLEYTNLSEASTLNIYDALIRNIDFNLCDKLHITELPIEYNSVFHRDIIKVYAMATYGSELISTYTGDYFISDDFYNTTLEDIPTDDLFGINLFKYIHGQDIHINEVELAIESISSDEYKYFKIPILCFIYMRLLNDIKV